MMYSAGLYGPLRRHKLQASYEARLSKTTRFAEHCVTGGRIMENPRKHQKTIDAIFTFRCAPLIQSGNIL